MVVKTQNMWQVMAPFCEWFSNQMFRNEAMSFQSTRYLDEVECNVSSWVQSFSHPLHFHQHLTVGGSTPKRAPWLCFCRSIVFNTFTPPRKDSAVLVKNL